MGWEDRTTHGGFTLPASTEMFAGAQRAFYQFVREVQNQDWGKKEHSQVSWVDRRYKRDRRTKEERDWSVSITSTHSMAPPWRSVTCFWAICHKWKLQRFPIDCSEMELNGTAHFLLMFLFYRCVHCPQAILVCSLQPFKKGILYPRDSPCTFVMWLFPYQAWQHPWVLFLL